MRQKAARTQDPFSWPGAHQTFMWGHSSSSQLPPRLGGGYRTQKSRAPLQGEPWEPSPCLLGDQGPVSHGQDVCVSCWGRARLSLLTTHPLCGNTGSTFPNLEAGSISLLRGQNIRLEPCTGTGFEPKHQMGASWMMEQCYGVLLSVSSPSLSLIVKKLAVVVLLCKDKALELNVENI